MMEMTADPPIGSKHKNRNFLWFCLFIGIKGAENGVVIPTLFSYLKNEIRPVRDLHLWYGVISCSYHVASILGSLFFTRYSDRTRNNRRIFISTCISIALGSFIYSLASFSVIFVWLGRLIQGFGDSISPIIVSEVIRNFTPQQCYHKINTLVSVYFLSFITSPVITWMFSKCDFTFIGVRFTVMNLPILLISCCWFACSLVCYTVIENITKENHNNAEDEEVVDEAPLTFKELLSSEEFVLVLLMAGSAAYFSASFASIYLSMISYEYYHLPTWWVSTLFAISVATLFLSIVVFSKMNIANGNKEIYFLVSGFCASIMAVQFLIAAVVYSSSNQAFGRSLLVLSAIATGFHYSSEQSLSVTILGKFIPPSTQAYAAGIRRATQSFCSIFTSLFSPIITNHIVGHGIVFSCLMLVMIVYLLWKRRLFVDVKVIKRKQYKMK